MVLANIIKAYGNIYSFKKLEKPFGCNSRDSEEIFQPFLSYFAEDLTRYFKAFMKETDLKPYSEKFISTSLETFRGELKGISKENELTSTSNRMGKDLEERQRLTSICEAETNKRLCLIKEAMHNISQNQEQLKKEFGLSSEQLKSTGFSVDYLPNCANDALLFSFSDSHKIIYKPYITEINEGYNKIIYWFNSSSQLKQKLKYMKVKNFDGFHVHDFIEYKESSTEELSREYHYRLGVHMLIFYLFRLQDLPSSCIMEYAGAPIVIDAEALFSNVNKAYFKPICDANYNQMLTESVLGSNILPVFWNQSNDVEYGDDFQLRGKRVVKYHEDLLQGFEDGYQLIINKKQEFKDKLHEILNTENILRQVVKRIDGISETDFQRQSNYIRQAIAIIGRSTGENTYMKYKVFSGAEELLTRATDIGDYLYHTAIWSQDTNSASWLLLNGIENYSLYEVGGVILFLAYLYHETQHEKYRRLLYAVLKGIKEPITSSGLSVFSGIGSLMYIFYNISVILEDKQLYSEYLKYLEQLEVCVLKEETIKLDFIDGLAGLIELSLNLFEQDNNVKLLQLAESCGIKLCEGLKQNDLELSPGFSRGYSGLSLALIHLGHITGQTEFYEAGIELIDQENKYYNIEKNLWRAHLWHTQGENPAYDTSDWCDGSAGIGLSRSLALKYADIEDYPRLEDDIFRACTSTFATGFCDIVDHSLYNGHFGNIDVLITMSEMMENKYISQFANEKAAELLNNATKNGVEYGVKKATDLLGGMSGISGIGIVLLRMVNPIYPSCLSLEVVKRR